MPFRNTVSRAAFAAFLAFCERIHLSIIFFASCGFSSKKDEIVYAEKALVEQYRLAIKHTAESLLGAGKSLAQNDPMRQLRLGYSILTKKERVIRSIHDIAPGERFEARLADGTLVGEVIDKIVTNE